MTVAVAGQAAHASTPWSDARAPQIHDCPHPWDRLDVTATGDLMACCFAQEVLGNLRRESLDEVLAGPRRRELQDDVRANRVNPGCLGAACLYAASAMERPWHVRFTPDRFTGAGRAALGRIWCRPNAGRVQTIKGPLRFVPAGDVEARVRLSATPPWRPGSGEAIELIAVDQDGRRLACLRASPRLGNSELALRFELAGAPRRRISIQLRLHGLRRVVGLEEMTLSGDPGTPSLRRAIAA